MQIRWEEEALSDLLSLRDYINQDNSTAAQKLAQRIIEHVNLLAEQPFLGGPGRIHTTRELVISKSAYTIIYHVSSDMVTILRVFHQARQWPQNL